jgi:hypothetical protein
VDVDRDKIERVVREVLSDVEAGHQPDLDADSSGDLVAIGADHGGYRLKETLKQYLTEELGYRVLDVGTTSEASCDYPDFAVSGWRERSPAARPGAAS